MKNKSVVLGGISIFLTVLSAAILYVTFLAAPIMNEPLILTLILLIAATLCSVCGAVFGFREFFKGYGNKILAVVGMVFNTLIGILFLLFWVLSIYLLINFNSKNFYF